MKKIFVTAISFLVILWTFSAFSYDDRNKQIVIGTTVGDFSDMVKEGLKPILEKKGFKVQLIEFTDFVRPNFALAEGSLDVNIFQHKLYLDEFSKAKNLKLSAIVQVPTAPFGIYAGKVKSLTDVKEGSRIAVPNDPTNLARALSILAALNWIEISNQADLLRTSLQDIVTNKKKLNLIQLEAAQLPRALGDVDFAVINGNFAADAGISLDTALLQEPGDMYLNWVVVRTSDQDLEFSKEIAAGFRSQEFRDYALKKFRGYKFPKKK
jgi:D-methionine transport system substrate-binding protein